MTKASTLRRRLVLSLGLTIVAPAAVSAAPKSSQPVDFCVTRRSTYTGNALDTLVFQDVATLKPGRTIPLEGIYFTPVRIPVPFHGSAVMASDGTIRIGIVIHYSARNQYDGNIYTNDKTYSGVTDASFAGTLNVDYTGDGIPDATTTLQSEDCATLSIP